MKKYVFETKNGQEGVVKIEEALLDTQDRAMARARAEFLKGSYTQMECSFDTYLTDLKINDIIRASGMRYKIIDIIIHVDNDKIFSSITGVRYAG